MATYHIWRSVHRNYLYTQFWKEKTQIDRGVFYSAYNDLKPESFINDYWNIVEENWLTAQIRLSGNGAIKKGWHLMASYALNVVEKGEDYYSDLYRR